MKRTLVVVLLGFAFVLGVGLTVAWQKIKLAQEKGNVRVVARSKPPGIIAAAYLAKSIDPSTGKAKETTDVFSPEDNDLYLVITFHTVVPGTRVEYVRYRNNKFLDHGSIELTIARATYGSINWSSHPPLGNRPKGTYLIKIYTNGRLEKTAAYTVS